jgi:hypothetical protein
VLDPQCFIAFPQIDIRDINASSLKQPPDHANRSYAHVHGIDPHSYHVLQFRTRYFPATRPLK